MARKTSPEPKAASLSDAQARAGIPKIERRISELKLLKIDELAEETYANILDGLLHRIDHTLVEVFGSDTLEYRRYSVGSLDDTTLTMFGEPEPIEWRRPKIKSAVATAISTLETAVAMLKEQVEDTGETADAKAIRAYSGLELHPEIARAASKLYKDGHYATAVEHAVKALNLLVRLRSGLEEDGTTLMERTFSPKNPILRFNALANQSDLDEQKGYMMMFSGAVSGLRNPRAHSFLKDKPERALEFIAYVSLLAKLLDEAEKV